MKRLLLTAALWTALLTPVGAEMVLIESTDNCTRVLHVESGTGTSNRTCMLQWAIEKFCDTETGDVVYNHHGGRVSDPVTSTVVPHGCKKVKK